MARALCDDQLATPGDIVPTVLVKNRGGMKRRHRKQCSGDPISGEHLGIFVVAPGFHHYYLDLR